MKIIKRDGTEVQFDVNKIVIAIGKANRSVPESERMDDDLIAKIANDIAKECENNSFAPNVEQIQDMVEQAIMKHGYYHIAQNYIRYRYDRQLLRKENSTDQQILSILSYENEEIKQENSNKNPAVISVQRDYMAGEVSKDITKRFLLPKDIWDAHEQGIIHFHDADYFAMQSHNCDLVNLEDMLQNGTVISGTKIDTPHTLYTACNITTQIIAQVASCQYGGQSFSLTHLAPFVDLSRQKYRKEVKQELVEAGAELNDVIINAIAEQRLQKEIKQSMQLIQYQIITLMTTNGQAPFVTVFMYINEAPEGQLRDDLVLLIEEMLKQRIQGVKNSQGIYITPAFPKLIYVLQENNIHEESEYWKITELAARCTAKRMVPDYISEKIMKELKGGDVYTCINETCA